MKQNFGCFNLTGLVAALVVLILAGASLLLAGGSLFSPGGLNATPGAALGGVTSHAGLGNNCAACHTPPFSPQTMNARCLVCHQDVAAQFNLPTGLHGAKMVKDSNEPCRDCHTEHHGPTASLDKTALTASIHVQFGFSLKAHPKLQSGAAFGCKDCHASGYTTFDQAICATCHAQINAAAMQAHVAAYGTTCTACHDGIDSYGKAFDHNSAVFKLTGKHSSLDCYACHTGDVKLADMKATSTQCAACHQKDDAHQGGLGQECGTCHGTDDWTHATLDHSKTNFPLTGAHSNVTCTSCHVNNVFKGTPTTCYACHQAKDIHNGSFGQDCGGCHKTDAWSDVTFDHSKSIFPLTGAHVNVTCTSCHVNNVFKGTPTTCYACHQSKDTHQGAFGQDCGACHKTDAWSDVTFDHAKSIFPLTGAHVNVACTSCHVNNVFKGTPTTCYACHQSKDTHQGAFGQDCGACHKTDAWSDVTFDHAKSSFPLTGAHLSLACTQCHINNVFKGTPAQCVGCHADPAYHAGLFGTNCASCHTTTAWVPASFNGAHTFPTNHGGANSCRSCHPNNLSSYTCYACHPQAQMVTRHASQGITDLSNCVRCHAGGGGDGGGGRGG